MQPRAMRFEIQRPIEYRVRGNAGPIFGTGRSLNISRRGLLFQAEQELAVGSKIEVMVKLGASPPDGPPINLQVHGVTLRSEKGRTAVAIKKYRLRPTETVTH